jgi:ABC-2 type transport system ATP-binding protein
MENAPMTAAGISKSYGGKRVLSDVGFTAESGEIFGLIGLNGAGKTTLIKIMLDLCVPDSGSASFFGVPARKTESRKRLAYLPESFRPARLLKGKEFLSVQLSFYGKKYDPAKAASACEELGLPSAVLDKKIGSYSKGMGQKLGLASAFLTEAPLLILDEPMSGLDPQARILLKKALLRCREQGRTVFFSSHILADVAEICGRVAVLHEGRTVFCGAPSACIAHYRGEHLEDAFMKAIAA